MKYNLIHKLLFVNTNVSKIYYFLYAPLLDNIIKGDPKYGVRFFVEKDVRKPEYLTQKFDYFWGKKNAKVIYYEHPILPGIKAKLLLDMSTDIYSITVNSAYYKFSKYRFENIWPPGQHLSNLITIKLLQNDILTLHGGAFSNKKTQEGFLVLAVSNTGKSRTTFAALKKGYEYHSEDLVILDKNYIYTSPLVSAQSNMLPDKNIRLKYNLFINKLTGINMFIPRMSALSPYRKFFSKYDVTYKAKLSKIFILEKGDESVSKLDKAEAVRKMLILNRLELSYSRDHLLLAYSYFNPALDIEFMQKAEKELIRQIVDKAECYLIKSNFPDRYMNLINKFVK
jgi:hypothetical protein